MNADETRHKSRLPRIVPMSADANRSGVRLRLSALSAFQWSTAFICGLLICGCKAPRIEDYRPSGAEVTAEALESQEESAAILLAEVNGVPITLAEYQRRLRSLSQQGQQRQSSPQASRALLESMILVHVLAQEAIARGLATDPSVAMSEAAALRDVVLEREAHAAADPSDIDDEAIAEYHYAHAYRYNRPEQRHLRLLLAPDRETAESVRAAVGGDRFASVAEDLRRFEELARARSLYPDLVDLGFVRRDQLSRLAAPRVVEAAFALEQPGRVTDAIEVTAGWAVLQLVENRLAIDQPIESAAENIRDEIVRERRAAALEEARRAARRSAEVQVDEALLSDLEAAAAPAPVPPAWVDLDEFVLNSRLTPGQDLTMLGQLLGAPPAPSPEEVPSAPEPHQP